MHQQPVTFTACYINWHCKRSLHPQCTLHYMVWYLSLAFYPYMLLLVTSTTCYVHTLHPHVIVLITLSNFSESHQWGGSKSNVVGR